MGMGWDGGEREGRKGGIKEVTRKKERRDNEFKVGRTELLGLQ